MKPLITILLFCSLSLTVSARDWYRIYLVTKINAVSNLTSPLCPLLQPVSGSCDFVNTGIPRFQRPKGAIFCRMEDYLTSKTKVWIKVGVK